MNNKMLTLALITAFIFGLTGCIGGDKNRPPNAPSIACPIEAEVDEEVAITVRSTDPDRDRISYKVAFGNGAESDWSSYLESGESATFTHIYTQTGDFGVQAIASDTHRDNSGWSDSVMIKVLPRPPPIGLERVMFCVGPDDNFIKIAALGVTVIQSYELPYLGLRKFDRIEKLGFDLSSSIQSSISFLDKARDANLKVYYSIPGMVHNQILATGSWNRNDVAEIIESCKDHPALFCWQPIEEANLTGRHISHRVQKEIYDFIKARDPNHPITQTLSGFVKDKDGGGKDWDYVNFNALDFITPNLYVYDGTGDCWGMKPLVALELGARQEREYLDARGITKLVLFVFQCCDEPAVNHDPPIENSEVPLGHIEDQFDVLKPYGLFTKGFALWAWNGGYFGPHSSGEMWREIKNLFDKIKGD